MNNHGSTLSITLFVMVTLLLISALLSITGISLVIRTRHQVSADATAISGAAVQAAALNKIMDRNIDIQNIWETLRSKCCSTCFRNRASALSTIELAQYRMDEKIRQIQIIARTGAIMATSKMKSAAASNSPEAQFINHTPELIRQSLFTINDLDGYRVSKNLFYKYCCSTDCKHRCFGNIDIQTVLEEKPPPLTHVVVELKFPPVQTHIFPASRLLKKSSINSVSTYAAAKPYKGCLFPINSCPDYKAWLIPIKESEPSPRIPDLGRLEH